MGSDRLIVSIAVVAVLVFLTSLGLDYILNLPFLSFASSRGYVSAMIVVSSIGGLFLALLWGSFFENPR